mmetsp:Transcript_4543/g.5564  ORF Transcript_4543/g.5564 Transcript_4543/m.5564 type:complete len:161 (-) Transcript_4543:8-490(-)
MSLLSSISRSMNTTYAVASGAATKLILLGGRTTSTTSTTCNLSVTNNSSLLVGGGGGGTVATQSRRQYWKEVLRIKSYDPKKKENPIVLEDVDRMVQRTLRAKASEGLERRQFRYKRYVKPWMKRKRAKEVKQYRAMERAVSNLKQYVKYVNEFHPNNRK